MKRPSNWLLVALGVLGVLVGLLGEWSSIRHNFAPEVARFDFVIGVVYLGAGLVAWRRRPENRVGPLMIAFGFAWFIGAWGDITDWNLPRMLFGDFHRLGNWDQQRIVIAFLSLSLAILLHLLLAYPTGRLTTRPARIVVVCGYATVIGFGIPRGLFTDFFAYSFNAYFHYRGFQGYLAAPNAAVSTTLERISEGIWVVLLLSGVAIVARRWYVSTPATRRALAPLWFAGTVIAITASVAAPSIVGELGPSGGEDACCTGGIWFWGHPYVQIPDAARVALLWVVRAGQLLIPLAFLFGLLRMGLRRLGMSRLVVELGDSPPPERIRDALARTLGDPTLQIAYWLPETNGYVDDQGRGFELPEPDSGRSVTVLERQGDRVAVLVHDPALAEQPELVLAAGTAARLAMENERLNAEVKARLEEVRASRARIVEAADAERHRVERNLHDGAQQRLVNLSLALGMAQRQVDDAGDALAAATLRVASAELKLAIADLRELARGIHPAILTDDGLAGALESLAERSPVPIALHAGAVGQLPSTVEATAYFVVSEALANVAKHARATGAAVTTSRSNGTLRVEVADDGVGGADPSHGSGLNGLADRLAAVDGRLVVDSAPGGGTRLVAEIPCG